MRKVSLRTHPLASSPRLECELWPSSWQAEPQPTLHKRKVRSSVPSEQTQSKSAPREFLFSQQENLV